MIKIVLIGAGNVASHLYKAFGKTAVAEVIQVFSQHAESLSEYKEEVETTTSLSKLKPADLYLVAVKDDAITQVITEISKPARFIVHTSGSVAMPNVSGKNGVFYPLQTFSKNVDVDFSNIPICLEASEEKSLELLQELANSISEKVFSISTEQRKSLHLAAVFVSNFSNHLYALAAEFCEANQVPFETLHALMLETTRKAVENNPNEVQTGPAIRHDQETIQKHLGQLKDPQLKEIYSILTKSIQAHGKKL